MQTTTKLQSFEAPSQTRTKQLFDVTVKEARARLRRSLQAEGFSVVAEIDLADLLNRRLDEAIEPCFIVEACHPVLARQVLAVAWDGGLLMPIKFCLWKEGSGVAVTTLEPKRLVEAIGRERLMDVASRIDERLERVFERLEGPEGAALAPDDVLPTTVVLSESERLVVHDATRYRIEELREEAARTESRPLQHDLAQSIERLEKAARKLDIPLETSR